jgi:hypothetical protein
MYLRMMSQTTRSQYERLKTMIAFPRPKLLDSSKRDQKLTRRKIESSLRHAKCVKSSAMSVHEDYSHLNLTATIKSSAC